MPSKPNPSCRQGTSSLSGSNASVGRCANRTLFVLLLLFNATGASCVHSLRNPFARSGPPAPVVLTPAASLDEIMAAVNLNARKIQSLQTSNASIKMPGSMGIPLLSGRLAAERPKRLRLQASAGLMGSVVDLGSNDELFWFWFRENEPPGVYFARHTEFAGGAAYGALPIQPEWLLDALGFAEFSPGDAHQGPLPLGNDKVEITSTIQTVRGAVTRKAVVDAQRAWVLEQHFYDESGAPLASTVARSHRYFNEAGVSVPQKVDINLPASDISMTIDLGDLTLNAMTSPQLWSMPTIDGAPPVDVGGAAVNALAPTAGNRMLSADWSGQAPIAGQPAPIQVTTAPSSAPSLASYQPNAIDPNVAALPIGPQRVVQQAIPPNSASLPPYTAVSPATGSPVTGLYTAGQTQPLQRLPAGGVDASTTPANPGSSRY